VRPGPRPCSRRQEWQAIREASSRSGCGAAMPLCIVGLRFDAGVWHRVWSAADAGPTPGGQRRQAEPGRPNSRRWEGVARSPCHGLWPRNPRSPATSSRAVHSRRRPEPNRRTRICSPPCRLSDQGFTEFAADDRHPTRNPRLRNDYEQVARARLPGSERRGAGQSRERPARLGPVRLKDAMNGFAPGTVGVACRQLVAYPCRSAGARRRAGQAASA
jgi:hypothetical protein